MGHSNSLKCTLCLQFLHAKCLPTYSDSDLDFAKQASNDWTCPKCLTEIFPYNSLDDTPFFLASINNPINAQPDLNYFHNLVYDPFESCEDDSEGVLGDVDPEQNFLNEIRGNIIQNCNYYYNNKLYDETKDKMDLVDLSICHLNIRSLPKNLDAFNSTLHSSGMTFKVLAFTETWLKPSNVDTHGISGFSHEFLVRDDKPGGGSSIFITNS
jgi:hypothetical protein